jgi:hypothetical protein
MSGRSVGPSAIGLRMGNDPHCDIATEFTCPKTLTFPETSTSPISPALRTDVLRHSSAGFHPDWSSPVPDVGFPCHRPRSRRLVAMSRSQRVASGIYAESMV